MPIREVRSPISTRRADGGHITPHVGKNALQHAPRTDVTPQPHVPMPKRPVGTNESPVPDKRR
jgi:hypothetical protein